MKRALLLLVTAAACSREKPLPPNEVPFEVKGGRIVVRPDSKLLARIEGTAASAVPGGTRELRTIGQIIALANPSGELKSHRSSWVELDSGLSTSLGLRLSSPSDAPVGLAFGFTNVPVDTDNRLAVGQRIEVARYGLVKSSTAGTIVSVRRSRDESGQVEIVFKIPQGLDWYPGTNCEVIFPLLQSRPAQVPTTSLLHEGLSEYVLVEVAPHTFMPRHVSVVGGGPDEAYVVGVNAGDRIVGRGAILLKPMLKQLITQGSENSHAP